MINDEIKRSQFAIILDPTFDEEGWTGDVQIQLEELDCGDLSDADRTQIRSMCNMLAGAIKIMDEDSSILNLFTNKMQKYNKNTLKKVDNVLYFDFKNKDKT